MILMVIEILGVFAFWKKMKYYNYELNNNESILFSISILITFLNSILEFAGGILAIKTITYLLGMLIFYYIIRSLKLKKYIPLKSIIVYLLTTIIIFGILFLVKPAIQNDEFALLLLFIIPIIFFCLYLITLLVINLTIWIIKTLKKDEMSYRNKGYKVGKSCFVSLSTVTLILSLIFFINFYEYNYNKKVEKQSQIVIDYLNKEYPNQDFEIIDTFKTYIDCDTLDCNNIPIMRNEIFSKTFNKNFTIDVLIDNLTIYDDGFKKIYDEEQKKSNEENIKEYLKNNYNVLLRYNYKNKKIRDVEFIIYKNYQKEEFVLFIQDMKNIFNYVEKNLYDIDYVDLIFEQGNPFYEGNHENFQTKGFINENSITNKLCIMVNDEYVFIEK